MISNNQALSIMTYRLFQIRIDRLQDTKAVSWWNLTEDYVGYQLVNSTEWSDGELLRFAMDAIDAICEQWDRIDYQTLTGRGQ